MSVGIFPDAEQALIAVLAVAGYQVADRLPDTDPLTWPRLVVTRVAGAPSPTAEWEDQPRLQVDCWADTKAGAMDAARGVVSVILSAVGQAAAGGGWLGGLDVVGGPLWSPDPDTNRPRYVLDVELRTTA